MGGLCMTYHLSTAVTLKSRFNNCSDLNPILYSNNYYACGISMVRAEILTVLYSNREINRYYNIKECTRRANNSNLIDISYYYVLFQESVNLMKTTPMFTNIALRSYLHILQ